jgi:hypothetical protein
MLTITQGDTGLRFGTSYQICGFQSTYNNGYHVDEGHSINATLHEQQEPMTTARQQ